MDVNSYVGEKVDLTWLDFELTWKQVWKFNGME